jgi:Ser/Thr protein kinase RdoA (MazF antagonist)
LHYDNVLVENGKVTGLLDFEFCAHDWRAMELAVCLSKVRSPLSPSNEEGISFLSSQ